MIKLSSKQKKAIKKPVQLVYESIHVDSFFRSGVDIFNIMLEINRHVMGCCSKSIYLTSIIHGFWFKFATISIADNLIYMKQICFELSNKVQTIAP